MPEVPLSTTYTAPNLRILGFEDQFERANGSVGVAPSGQTWESSSTTGVAHPLVIASGKALRGSGGTAARTAWTLNGADSDGDVSGKISELGDATGTLITRVLDADNYIALAARATASDKKYILQARVGGQASTLGSTTGGVASAAGDVPRLRMDYDQIYAYVGSTLLFSGPRPCPTSLLYGTRHGLLLQGASSGVESWDWVQFIPLGY